MTNKNLFVLSIVAAVTLIWAVVQSQVASSRAKRPQRALFEDSYLIQGLNLAAISSIRIGDGEEPLTLLRQGDRFTISSKDDYPADTQTINRLLIELTDIRVTELVTDNEQNHASLKVAENDAEGIIRFFDRDGNTLLGVAIGSQHSVKGGSGPSHRYVRLLSSPDVFLAEGVPDVSDSALDYLNKELLKLEDDKIVQIETAPAAGPAYVLQRSQNGAESSYRLDELPEGRELDDGQAASIFSAFANIRLQEVRKAGEWVQNLEALSSAACLLENELAYRIELLKQDEKFYARLSAEFLGDGTIVKENRVESDEELKVKEAKLLALDTAESVTQFHQGWIYEIQPWKAEKLLTTRDGLLKKIEDPEDPEREAGTEGLPASAE